jgi:hypothetical protein
MSTLLKPWELHQDLTEDRLRLVAELIRRVRNSTVDSVEAERVPWGAGCLIYDRTRDEISRLSGSNDWLTILDSSMCFVFRIGAVPVRFYKGPPDDPSDRTLADHNPELNQLGLAFGERGADLKWRYAVDTAIDGKVVRVSFVGIDESRCVRSRWDYDAQRVVHFTPKSSQQPIARKLAPASVSIKSEADAREADAKE